MSDNVLRELFRNQGLIDYSDYEVYLNFEYEFNYISNTWKISGFEESGFNDDYGFNQFDFGGAGKPNQHYGVRDYTLKFGGKLVNFGRYEIVHKKHLFKIGKIG